MRRLKKVSTTLMLLLVFTVVSFMPAFQKTIPAEAASSVELNKTKMTLYVGKSYTLKVSGTSATVTWKSSKTSVATVTKAGKVTAKKAGSATITATVNSKKYTCKVTVKNATVVYGKVTAISGKTVTLALGTMNQPDGAAPNGAPTAPNGTPAAPSGIPAAMPSGTPQNSSGTTSGAPDLLTLTGKSITITISDTSIISKENIQMPDKQSSSNSSNTSASSKTASATLSDITVGSILKVSYTSSTSSLTSVIIMGGGGMSGGTMPMGNSTVSTGSGAYNLVNAEALNGGTYTSTNADENAIRAGNSIKASLTDVTVTKFSGAASNSDASSFYGLNAAILALGGATLDITGGSVTASAEGANGVFAYDGATVNISDTTINVSGGNAGGIEVAGGGIMNATNLSVTSKVKAAIRSDRGGGTLNVNGGTYTTSGSSGAPAVYSTANVTVNNATLTANTSEAIVVEGLNSVILNDCTVTGNMSGTYASDNAENIHNVMLYQSMSGDAEVGNSSFTMTGGSLTSKNGDMFYMTNTEGIITLSNVTLTLAADTKLLVVAGNSSSRGWGTSGSNGGECTFVASNQTLTGDISIDKISKLAMTIKNSSSYTGAVNSNGTTAAALSVTLDSSSTWTLTADSYITEFTGSMSNVITNGHTLYVNGVAMN